MSNALAHDNQFAETFRRIIREEMRPIIREAVRTVIQEEVRPIIREEVRTVVNEDVRPIIREETADMRTGLSTLSDKVDQMRRLQLDQLMKQAAIKADTDILKSSVRGLQVRFENFEYRFQATGEGA